MNDSPGDLPLTHLAAAGPARMVDVSEKRESVREAIAEGAVRMSARTLALIQKGGVAKGDVLAVARVAGIMAAKRTGELIPLCHPLPLDAVTIEFGAEAQSGALTIRARARTRARTGVEMEAMTAVSVAALTIYDMCKAVDRSMVVSQVRLESKSGGKSGDWSRPGHKP